MKSIIFITLTFFALSFANVGQAVAEEDESEYSPLIDYSDLDENSDQEADAYFFKYGRLFSISAQAGIRGFTGNLNRAFKPGILTGLSINYFLNLRYALTLGYSRGNNKISITSSDAEEKVTGKIEIDEFSLGIKFYPNTQNMHRMFSSIHPYFFGGVTSIGRTLRISGEQAFAKENSNGVVIGLGIDFPLNERKDISLGFQGNFNYIELGDESNEFPVGEDGKTSYKASGDIFDGLVSITVNF